MSEINFFSGRQYDFPMAWRGEKERNIYLQSFKLLLANVEFGNWSDKDRGEKKVLAFQ